MATRYLHVAPVVLEPGTRSGMPILYDNPRHVGPDRIANAVGAFDLFGGPTIVVDFGTATTLDATSAAGEYLGGAILPGIEISLDALFDRAAALSWVELVPPRRVIGKSTPESIQSGVLFGTADAVDGLCRRFEEDLGPCTVVSTGGLGHLIAPLSDCVQHHRPVAHPPRPAPHLRDEPCLIYEMNVPDARSFRPTTTAAELQERWSALPPGTETGEQVAVAGRLMLRREQGKVAFGTLDDATAQDPAVRPHRRHPPVRGVQRPLPRRLDRRHRRGHDHPAGRAVGAGRRLGPAGRGPPPVPRQVARPGRPRHPLPPALRRPVGHRGVARTRCSCAAG